MTRGKASTSAWGRPGSPQRPIGLRREDGGARCNNDVNPAPNKLREDFREALFASLREAVLDRDGAALDPAEFAQPVHERGLTGESP